MSETATAPAASPAGSPTSAGLSPEVVRRLADVLAGDYAEDRRRNLQATVQLDLAAADGLDRDAYRDLVLDWCKQLAAQGLGGRSFPKQYGGEDNPGGSIAGFQAGGHGDLSALVKMGVQFGLFGGAVHKLGTERHHEAYLRDIASLALPGCFAMTETGHGSDVRSLRTQARYDAEAREFVIHTPDESARKDWIGNAARHARMAAVFAQLDVAGDSHGVHAFLVPLRDEDGNVLPGITINDCGDKMGLQGVDNGQITFNAVRVPREALLDRYGQVSEDGTYTSSIDNPAARFFTMIGALVEGRICIAAAGISVARNALTIAVRYGERRRQFGEEGREEVPLMDYLTHQRRLLPPVATSYVLQFAHEVLTERHIATLRDEPGADKRGVESLAAGLKAYATWHAARTVQDARECCGGQGYLTANRFASLKADSEIFMTFEGDNTVLMQLVAKSLLMEHKSQFEDMDVLGTARYAASLGMRQLGERVLTWLAPTGDSDDVARREWQLEAFRSREERLVDALGRRLRSLVGSGQGALASLIHCQDHALAAATAHVERVLLEHACERIQAEPEGEAREVLERLVDLYALSALERDRGWWLEHGLMSAAQAKDIPKRVNALCRELRPAALDLVATFDIPEELLRAPIAT